MTGTAITAGPITVLVVDDSFFMRKVIVDILTTDPNVRIVGQAASGAEALEKITALNPDVVTLDLVMPGLEGLEVLRKLQSLKNAPAVVIVSAHSREAADITLQCLEAGAVDFVLKPSDTNAWSLEQIATDLRTKIRAAATIKQRRLADNSTPKAPQTSHLQLTIPHAIVIGSSTGGPLALEQLLPGLPADLPCAVLIAQHMPSGFVEALVGRLAERCALPVQVAMNGQTVEAGHIYFCPGDTDTAVRRRGNAVVFDTTPATDILSPSIDTLMSSAAFLYTTNLIGIVLTGMGEDSVEGARAIHENGGTVLVQDESTAAIYGMGKAVAQQGLADAVLPLADIVPHAIQTLAREASHDQ